MLSESHERRARLNKTAVSIHEEDVNSPDVAQGCTSDSGNDNEESKDAASGGSGGEPNLPFAKSVTFGATTLVDAVEPDSSSSGASPSHSTTLSNTSSATLPYDDQHHDPDDDDDDDEQQNSRKLAVSDREKRRHDAV